MEQRDPPPTEEGWYALHDFRTIDWDAWRNAPEHRRERALAEGVDYLQSHADLEDIDAEADEFGGGATAVYTVLGHKADIMVVHLRPTMADLDTAERQFEQTAFAEFTEQPSSYLSVTEASGYTEKAREYFEGEVDDDSGLAQYIQKRLHPDVPDAEHVCFYPMSKRRQPEQNWYDLPFDERAEIMADHGDIGRGYAGKVNQMIASSVGLDDWEWGITLWADDPTDIKDLLNEMRFDPSSSHFAEFGDFYFGRRFPPTDLPAVLAGEHVPTGDTETAGQHAETSAPAHAGGSEGHSHEGHSEETAETGDHDEESEGSHGGGPPSQAVEEKDVDVEPDEGIQQKLATLGIYPGQDYEEGATGLVFYSQADAQELADEVDSLRSNFEHYDTHVLTTVRANQGRAAIASVWKTASAADTASGFLNDLSGIVEGYRGPLGEGDEETEDVEQQSGDEIRGELEDLDIYAGKPHGEDVYALVLYSEADREDLFEEVDDLRDGFDRYDTHVKTAVYDSLSEDDDRTAIVSIWETQDAADTASDFLTDLPDIVGRADERASGHAGEEPGFGTMGMFYTVKPEHRDDFVEKFGDVGELLADMEGHHDTALMVNQENENDMFISSQWRAKEDAMDFFRSDAFSETVSWGQDVLDDRPRHVFLA